MASLSFAYRLTRNKGLDLTRDIFFLRRFSPSLIDKFGGRQRQQDVPSADRGRGTRLLPSGSGAAIQLGGNRLLTAAGHHARMARLYLQYVLYCVAIQMPMIILLLLV